MSFWETPRHKVLIVAAVYAAIASLLAALVELTMPVAIPRLLITLFLAFGFPVVLVLAWVFAGRPARRRAKLAAISVFGVGVLVWLHNTSRFAEGDVEPYFIAHRGVHQIMNPEHDDSFRCLGRIYEPKHSSIENAVPSIRAAFDHGARFVEIDIRATADGDFAVFHDGMLDCKTEVEGPVIDRTMAELRELDVGYGYFTAQGVHPLRGQGIGLMRSLDEILDAFPAESFIIDAKFGGNWELWSRLIKYLGRRSAEDQQRLAVAGHPQGVERLQSALPNVTVSSAPRALRCARSYILVGWTGYVPELCHRTITGTYANTGWIYWGWPSKLAERMERAKAIFIVRPQAGSEQDFAASIPAGYAGGIQTDRIEVFRAWMSDVTL